MNLGDLLLALYDDLGYRSSPDTAITTRLTRYVNEGHAHVLRLPASRSLRQGTLTFASVADQPTYGLPSAFETIDRMVQESNNIRLIAQSLDWFRRLDPGERSNGTPYVWIDLGLQPVMQQPASTGLWVVSTAAGDTATVRITAVRANGDPQAEATVSLNGTTRAQLGSVTDYTLITRWEVGSTCTGVVSLYDASTSGHELARIPIGQTTVQYQQIRLFPTPAAAVTYTVDGLLVIPDLVNNVDTPRLPILFHDMLAVYARMREYARLGDSDRYPVALQEWTTWLGRLTAYLDYPPDYRPRAGYLGEASRWSNLPGGWFPADGWGT